MKILFLDFDGVLNSHKFLADRDCGDHLDPRAVALVNQVIQATNCRVVITSTWRCYNPLEVLQARLAEHGLNPNHVVGVTPITDMDINRAGEIKLWLDANKQVEVFAIVDDWGPEVFKDLTDRLVQTDPKVGITPKDVAKLIDMLSMTDKDWEHVQDILE